MTIDLIPPPPRPWLPARRTRPTVAQRVRWLIRRAPDALRASPRVLWRELKHTCRGLGACWRVWRTWVTCASDAARLDRCERHSESQAARLAARQGNARKLTVAGSVIVAAGGTWLCLAVSPAALALAAIGLIVALDAVGHRVTDDLGVSKGRGSPFREGASLKSVVASVNEYLEEHAVKATVTGACYDAGDGVALTLRHDGPLGDDFVQSLEQWMRTFRGAVHTTEDRNARGESQVTVSWTDHLAASTLPPMLAPGSRRGAEPAIVGVSANGQPTIVDRWRVSVLIVGTSGAGKSSGANVLLDADTANDDIRLDGIDLRQGGGVLLNAWGDLIGTLAITVEQAEALLDRYLAEAERRTAILGARSRPGAPNPGPENWEPADGPQWVLWIEELPLLADHKQLVAKYLKLLRIGRAAAVVSVAIAQDMQKDTVGSTGLRKYQMTTVVFACDKTDVTQLFGGGAIDAGWRPHDLDPSTGPGQPNDAGRSYIKSPRYPNPMQHRWFRLDNVTDIHPRVFARLAHRGQPADQPGESTSVPFSDLPDDDVVDGEVLTDEQVAVLAVFDAHDATWLPSAVLCEALGIGPEQLAKDMGRPAERGLYEGRRCRGYPRP